MKIAFIVPYFGAFPSAFQLWLDSCAVNKDIDWLLFTDNHEPYLYPRNVHVYHVAFEELQAWFQTLLGFKIWLGNLTSYVILGRCMVSCSQNTSVVMIIGGIVI